MRETQILIARDVSGIRDYIGTVVFLNRLSVERWRGGRESVYWRLICVSG